MSQDQYLRRVVSVTFLPLKRAGIKRSGIMTMECTHTCSNGAPENRVGEYIPCLECEKIAEGQRIAPIESDPPCGEYDPAGPGAGLEADGFVQCAQCGHPKSAHQ